MGGLGRRGRKPYRVGDRVYRVGRPTWRVYVLVSRSAQLAGRTYVGITLDVERRLAQHNGEVPGGAKSTRAGRPWAVGRWYGPYGTRAEATRAELAVKKLRGLKRLEWERGVGREAGSDSGRV